MGNDFFNLQPRVHMGGINKLNNLCSRYKKRFIGRRYFFYLRILTFKGYIQKIRNYFFKS